MLGVLLLKRLFLAPEAGPGNRRRVPGATLINLGIGLVGVSLAFGLTVLTMAFTIGHISGCHLNPAVSVGLCVGEWALQQLWLFWVAPILGAILAGVVYPLMAGDPEATGKSA